MPIRFLTHLEMPVAALLTMLATVSGSDIVQSSGVIWDKTELRRWCIIGAMMGAFLAIGLLPSKETIGNYTRRLAVKFACSGILGVALTPVIIRKMGWPMDTDFVLAVSCGVAATAVSIYTALWPWVLRKITGVVKAKIDVAIPTAPSPVNPPVSPTTPPPAE